MLSSSPGFMLPGTTPLSIAPTPVPAGGASTVVPGRSGRYPVTIAVLIVVLVFITILVAVGVDPLLAAALAGTAGTVAARLSPRIRGI